MIATEADGLILAISRRPFRLARLGTLAGELSFASHHLPSKLQTPFRQQNILAGLAWRDSIFVVLVDSLHFTHKSFLAACNVRRTLRP